MVEFVTPEQRQHYGHYRGEPSLEQVALYFHLDDRNRVLLEPRRYAHTCLGFALQLYTVGFSKYSYPIRRMHLTTSFSHLTRFFSHFAHVSDSHAYVEDLALSLSAVLLLIRHKI